MPEAQSSAKDWRDTLVQRGYQEAITYSFVEPQLMQRVDPEHTPVALANPISSEMSVMRTSLWPGLLKVAQYNINRQQARVRIFEHGLNYIKQLNELKQEYYIGGLVCGSRLPEQWGVPQVDVDYYDVKADIEALLATATGGRELTFTADRHACLHPGQTARIQRAGKSVGWLGKVHPGLVIELELPENSFLFEIAAGPLSLGQIARFQTISKFPVIRRDLAFILPQAIISADICESVRQTAGTLLQGLTVFDLYQGKAIESGLKSIALGLILQDSSRTLTEQDVEGVLVQVQAALNAKFGATLRE